jgi:hypothetical protein
MAPTPVLRRKHRGHVAPADITDNSLRGRVNPADDAVSIDRVGRNANTLEGVLHICAECLQPPDAGSVRPWLLSRQTVGIGKPGPKRNITHFIDHDTGAFIVSSEHVGVAIQNFLHYATLDDIATLNDHLLASTLAGIRRSRPNRSGIKWPDEPGVHVTSVDQYVARARR